MKVLQLSMVFVCCIAEEYQLEYYTELTLSCDETEYNFTQTNPASKYWLLPDGNLTRETGEDNKRMAVGKDMTNFTLTLKRLNDPDFGWYYCLIVWGDHSVSHIRHGVNIDGAFFGDLLDRYRHNAMIGGIAAGILFAILAGTCIVWHCRYQKHDDGNQAVEDLGKAIDGYDTKAFDNIALEKDSAQKEYINNVSEQDDKL